MLTKAGSEIGVPKRKLSKNTLATTEGVNLIYQLCEVKARAKTIAYLMRSTDSSFTPADIGRIYKDIHGESPSKGMMPVSPERAIGSSEKRFHASYYGKKYKRLSELGLIGARLHLATYQHYLLDFECTVDDALLSFDLGFKIIQSIQIGELVYATCRDCRSHFLNVMGSPLSNHACPLCAIFKKRQRKVEKEVAESDSALKKFK
ncbi:FlhC family transcriptional regulator [Undibacterium arcticum]|uniref:FlhC family transcriptional regulator n=1 Tax=Undibacterium arcticum TaxID=1762892 RepID=A0ABV7F7P8_9BURK